MFSDDQTKSAHHIPITRMTNCWETGTIINIEKSEPTNEGNGFITRVKQTPTHSIPPLTGLLLKSGV